MTLSGVSPRRATGHPRPSRTSRRRRQGDTRLRDGRGSGCRRGESQASVGLRRALPSCWAAPHRLGDAPEGPLVADRGEAEASHVTGLLGHRERGAASQEHAGSEREALRQGHRGQGRSCLCGEQRAEVSTSRVAFPPLLAIGGPTASNDVRSLFPMSGCNALRCDDGADALPNRSISTRRHHAEIVRPSARASSITRSASDWGKST